MKTIIDQKEIAEWLEVSKETIGCVFRDQRHLSWPMAKKIADKSGAKFSILRSGTGRQIESALVRAYKRGRK